MLINLRIYRFGNNVKADGTVVVWGTCTNGEKNVPAFESKPVELYGGRYHFTALMDDGEVISWGDNTHGQASVPASFNDKEIVTKAKQLL